MRVLLTGAFGKVGTAILDHLVNKYDFVLLDKNPHPELESITGDVADYPAFNYAAQDVEAIIHLAGNPSVEASWPATVTSNIIGVYNCFEIARRKEIPKVIFASTNHVVGMYERELAPELYGPEFDFHLDDSTPIRPDSHYGVSKVYGEAISRYYVNTFEFPQHVFNLRIGSVRAPENDHPYADAEERVASGEIERGGQAYQHAVNRMKATWLSRKDMAHLVDCCLQNDDIEFGIYYGVSDNERRWFDIETARTDIGFEPNDSADDWSEPPARGKLNEVDSYYVR